MAEKDQTSWDYDQWDPMKEDFDYGIPIRTGMDGMIGQYVIPEKDMLCQHYYKPGGRCFKENCLRSHPVNKAKEFDPITGQKILKEAIPGRKQLEDLSVAQNLCTFTVKIQHVRNPWDFYCNILKSDDLVCCCECPNEEDQEHSFDTENKLRMSLTKTMNEKFTLQRSIQYAKDEVVVVKRVDETGKMYFLRGIMIETLVLETEEKIDACMGNVFCCDTGETLTVPLLNIARVGPEWIQFSVPLAFHCSLAGIYPKGKVWSSEETEFFRSVVRNKNGILRVVKTVYPESHNCEQEKPYDVELYFREDETNKYMSVAKLMGKKFFGIMRPATPFIIYPGLMYD